MRKLICIECPKGCCMSVELAGDTVIAVSGNTCPKGETYARAEIERSMRLLTSTVAAKGLSVEMIPVRTDGPIPKKRLFDAMQALKKITVDVPVAVGDSIAKNFLGLGVNLIATREAEREKDRD